MDENLEDYNMRAGTGEQAGRDHKRDQGTTFISLQICCYIYITPGRFSPFPEKTRWDPACSRQGSGIVWIIFSIYSSVLNYRAGSNKETGGQSTQKHKVGRSK